MNREAIILPIDREFHDNEMLDNDRAYNIGDTLPAEMKTRI